MTICDLVFTVKCPYCGKVICKNEYACESCKKQFPHTSLVTYAVGGYKCVCHFPYDGIFAKAVKNFKFYGNAAFAKSFAFVLVQSIIEIYKDEHFDFITSVPMHIKQKKQRGYNQSELLAKECALILNIPYVEALNKSKQNKIQHSIKAPQRGKNVKGVYKVTDKSLIQGKNLLIIDDIITTGNTLGECSKTLIEGGCKKVCCASLCTVIIK